MTYIAPLITLNSFTCPYCNVLAQQIKSNQRIDYNNQFVTVHLGARLPIVPLEEYPDYDIKGQLTLTSCQACFKYHIWLDDKMLYPSISSAPMPSDDMPTDIKLLYMEARDVRSLSPKSSAALLRLALQQLCIHLGEKGDNINDDIKSLVQKGLDAKLVKVLDILRITGNNAVHPGELNLDETPDIVDQMFAFMNFIVQQLITQPKEIETYYNQMPLGAIDAISKRNK